MTWNIFRSKHQRHDSTSTSRSKGHQTPPAAATLPYCLASSPNLVNPHTSVRPALDPESNPLSGLNELASPTLHPSSWHNGKPILSSNQNTSFHQRRASMHSAKSTGGKSDSLRSLKSGVGTMRARQLKMAAQAAKRAAAQYIAENSEKSLICYTCGHKISSIRCETCRTIYLSPNTKCNEISVALFNDIFSGGYDIWSTMRKPSSTTSGSGISISSVSISGANGSSATSFRGIYTDGDEEISETKSFLDFDLVYDLVTLNESNLLEAILFECFSYIEGTAYSFYISSKVSCDLGDTQSIYSIESKRSCSSSNLDIIDTAAVMKFYDTIANISSTAPMRGILHGAQSVLQTRKHAPIGGDELAFICIILLCPAITDCSMFTKITGPLQKLSKYASLRSRARTILETCAGLVVHSNKDLHPLFISIFATVDQTKLGEIVDLCNAYVSHRLSFDFHYKSRTASQPSKFKLVKHDWYSDDWRISAVVQLMSLLWQSNKIRADCKTNDSLPTYRFYNTMVDFVDIKSDFDSWQAGLSKPTRRFCFCRYPFILSMGSKATVFEHSIQRIVNSAIQREMFAMMSGRQNMRSVEAEQRSLALVKYYTLTVRRQHLLSDSVSQLKEWPCNKRRALKVEFTGEPGIDAGGLKREWFLMFFKELFSPELHVFEMDETSNYCWFGKNPDTVYYTVAGVALGLALFNSVTVDLNLPLLLFKLLLDLPYDLHDVAKLWPDIAQSLINILDYENEDFEDIFGLTFVAPDGTDLLANGNTVNVTISSKETYVKLLVEHLVNVEDKPFQSFKKAFLDVCGGNAITLFQADELELLTRGDRKPIDVPALRSVTKYVNFGHRYEKANMEPVVQWFWDFFEKLDPASQARLLQFVTATDRPPASGTVQMRFSIMCLGGDSERLPIAHTCFNQLCLYKYKTRRKLEGKLSLAIVEYQGFGLK